MAHRLSDLELHDDRHQTRRQWRVERVAWVLLLLWLVAVALGLFGNEGLLSTVTLQSPDRQVRLEHQRFLRAHSPDRLTLRVQAAGDTVRLSIAQAVLARIDIDKLTPEPQQVVAREDATDYVLGATPGRTAHIVVQLMPERLGPVDGWLAVDGRRLPLRPFVYP